MQETVTVTVEDLALRGGPSYGYRLNVNKLARDFQGDFEFPRISTFRPEVRLAVPVTVQRQGFDAEVDSAGGESSPRISTSKAALVVGGAPVKEPRRIVTARGVLILTADAGTPNLDPVELNRGRYGKLPDSTDASAERRRAGDERECGGSNSTGLGRPPASAYSALARAGLCRLRERWPAPATS